MIGRQDLAVKFHLPRQDRVIDAVVGVCKERVNRSIIGVRYITCTMLSCLGQRSSWEPAE